MREIGVRRWDSKSDGHLRNGEDGSEVKTLQSTWAQVPALTWWPTHLEAHARCTYICSGKTPILIK